MLTAFYSDQYHRGIDHLGAAGKQLSQPDAIIKPQWVADALRKTQLVELREPELISEHDVLTVHGPEYIQALKTGQPKELAESSGLRQKIC